MKRINARNKNDNERKAVLSPEICMILDNLRLSNDQSSKENERRKQYKQIVYITLKRTLNINVLPAGDPTREV